MLLQGKTVLITGGSSGIGHALAKLLKEKGANVYSFDKNVPQETVEGINYVNVDITNSSQIEKSLYNIPIPIDVLVNNAGVMRRGTIFDSTEDEFDLLFDTNLKGSWLILKYAKSRLSDKATVVQLSSGHALRPQSNPGLYTLVKRSAIALAEILQLTCPEYSVKIVCPGPVDTPLLRYGRNEEEINRVKK